MARKITKRQQQIYDFIKEYQQEKGYPPSVREMASAVGLSSPSTVHAHLSALEARGLLKRDATKPRALELFDEDGSSVSISKSDEPTAPRGTVSLPLVGRVAAGIPILAEQNIEARIGIPAAWRADFALTCKGDSMEPKIKDGDIVAIRTQPEVENGEVAAVRIGEEATLKRVFVFPDHLELRAENPAFSSIILIGEDMNTVHIEGKAVGFCRGI